MELHASTTPCTHPGVVMHLKLMLNLDQDHILYIKDGRSHCDVTVMSLISLSSRVLKFRPIVGFQVLLWLFLEPEVIIFYTTR